MVIETAEVKDIKSILKVFEECTTELLSANIQQWDGTYPTKEIFQLDIKEKQVFIIRNENKILATITLNDQQDEQYEAIRWKYNSKKVLVIHRLAVSPKAQGMGLGKMLCQYSEAYGHKNGYDVIRLDAYSGNEISCGMYEKLNYQRAEGICWFHGNELPFYCYEKQLERNG